MKRRNIYYVAHPRMGTPQDTWSKRSLAEAVEHAKEILTSGTSAYGRWTGGEEVLVVKVVRVVRKKEIPIVVETVR